ncbi:rhamnulokinase [Vibrio viridaestus]|uniref:Rhamnulokinase n=1 Tax=Vibrio viridaestus TaxID=2487322 RepID=A0A3N9U1U2_9VIBR|nr:rhamnulokinase [Vibrio viridaestus]RQW61896.1 rhamnulokinase [Vibrio viridaestus]
MKGVIAIDLGASSGRVMVGYLDGKQIGLKEFHRFTNQQVMHGNESCWDLYSILEEIKVGINKALASEYDICSLGIDSWGVDFVLLDKFGKHLGEFVSYRDARTQGSQEKLEGDNGLSKRDIYGMSGIQFLTFNTINQLKAISDQKPEWFDDIDTLLFIPDYLNYKLCGVKHCEYTNASTSQLLDCHEKTWNKQLIDACGAKLNWFLPPKMPNRIIGQYQLADIQIPVCSVASHDTASAVAATPLTDEHTAYLSSGTWSLVGIESEIPFTNSSAFEANLTNEGGVDGRYRVLKNIMGLWLIQRIKAENLSLTFSDIALLAGQAEPFKYVINANDDAFLNPDSMTQAIKNWFTQRDQPGPQTLAEIVRCIYDSLVLAYDDALTQLSYASGRTIKQLRIVGGGTQDQFLNQLCADVCGIEVATEPTEASVLGNVINQFIALDMVSCLEEGRQIIHASSQVKFYSPREIVDLDNIKSQYQLIK